MKKIFINKSILNVNDKIQITGDDYHHMAKVLRVRIGESFIISDSENKEFTGKIIEIDKEKILISLNCIYERIITDIPEITIFFSILKGDKNELLLQKCSEIGVNYFIPVITKNTIVKLNNKESDKKIFKWQKIVKEAAMQALLYKIPLINEIKQFEQLKDFNYNGIKIFCNIQEKNNKLIDILKSNKERKPMAFFIGPEGDFDKKEIESLKDWHWESVNLSQNILKSETATIFTASSVFSYFYQNNIQKL